MVNTVKARVLPHIATAFFYVAGVLENAAFYLDEVASEAQLELDE